MKTQKDLISMKLQLFAEDEKDVEKDVDQAKDKSTETDEDKKGEDKKKSERLFTRDEMAKIVDAQVDAKLQKLKEEEAEKARKESLTKEEALKEEFDELKATLEKERKSLEKEKLTLDLTKYVTEKGLSTEVLSFVTARTYDKAVEQIESFNNILESNLETRLNEKLGNAVPKSGSSKKSKLTEDELYEKMFSK